MPKRMIVYATKSGTTEACAKELAGFLPESELFDLRDGIPFVTDDIETVILGGSIRMGTLHKRAKKFIVQNKEALFHTTLGIFICNGFLEQADDLLDANIPSGILKHAAVISSFGGNCDPEIQRGLDKMMMRAVIKDAKEKKTFKEPRVLHGVIKRFAAEIQKAEVKKK